jgi:pimeloyl-ACP methyl ester carboxylesterase
MFVIKYLISLSSIKHDFGKSRNLIVHHGLMGSSKNFRSICKNPAISKYANVHLIDARNHGN